MSKDVQVQLPERVTINLSAQEAVTILNALSETGPYKTVAPLIASVQQQVFSQQIRSAPIRPPVPVEADGSFPVADKLADTADIPAEAVFPIG